MKNFDNINDAEYLTILNDIQETYKEEVLQPIAMSFIKFFTKLQNFEDGYRTHKSSKEIKVISVCYYGNSTLAYIFAMNCYDFYQPDEDVEKPELHIDYYHNYDVDTLVCNIFKKHNVNYDASINYLDFWENQYDIDINFLLDCWNEAKEITNSKLYAFLSASDGTGGIRNMDTREWFSDGINPVEKYLTQKGIHIKKDAGV